MINLYTTLSPVMQIATGGSMLNFGYWTSKHKDPISAQNNLCLIFAAFAELSSSKHAVDVGSGLSAPSIMWRDLYPNLHVDCVNINFNQLSFCGPQKNIEFINSTSTKLPFSDDSVDRVLALESAQHFKPLTDFINESKRILIKDGLFVLAVPVTLDEPSFKKLGLLKFTWSSEHYSLEYLKNLLTSNGFQINDEKLIGSSVYDPLADYYMNNRSDLQKLILKKYPDYVENILFKSIKKMKKASEEKVIDYVILKCTLKSNSIK